MNKCCCPNNGKKSYHHGNLRETLISSALDILKDGNLNDLSLRALARRAGVSQTAPYRHFEDKEELIAVLKTEGLSKLGDTLRQRVSQEKNPVTRMHKLGQVYVEFAQKYPAHFKVMFEYELSDYHKYCELNEVAHDSFRCLQETVDECLALPNARDIDPITAQFSAWSLVHGLSVLLMNESLMQHMKEAHMPGMHSFDKLVEQVTGTFCNLLVKL